jgi:hypothetical protein
MHKVPEKGAADLDRYFGIFQIYYKSTALSSLEKQSVATSFLLASIRITGKVGP